MSDDDRVVAHIVHAQILSRMRRLKEAHKVLSEAKVNFAGTPQEVQILVASAKLAVERGDYDAAVRMLDKIDEDHSSFMRAQLLKADILLNHARDKEGYTKCHHELVEREPSAKTYSLLGQAYLRILNPEAAVNALENAYKLDPSNSRLRARIGRALTATHEFHRAVDFYEAALREERSNALEESKTKGKSHQSDIVSLSHGLAGLYLKLGRGENAARVLEEALHSQKHDRSAVSGKDIEDLRQDVQTLLLLTKVKEASEHSRGEVSQTLELAKKCQEDVIQVMRINGASVDLTETEKSKLSEISQRLGGWLLLNDKQSDAEEELKFSLQADPHNIETMLTLANLYRSRGVEDMSAVELCRAQCKKVISSDPSNEAATIILSESMFTSEEPDAAVTPLQDLLRRAPNNYHALEKLTLLLRRSGRLEEVPPFIEGSIKADSRADSHPGYHFCKGLYARFTKDPIKAVTEFNQARRDSEWGPDALVHMIELYLNPDNDSVWDDKESGPLDDTTSENISVAEVLLRELEPKARDKRRLSILQNYCLLATRQQKNIDEAMKSFITLLEEDKDYLPAVLGMATGFMVEKSQHKARNLLKRVAQMEIRSVDGEDFERANLLLAKNYIDKGKYDLAQDLCKRCLAQNKSCSVAWEILGMGLEKEGDYEKAAECYEKAWKLEFELSATIGYKLAFCHMNSQKPVNAIDVCEIVLAQFPDYPRIREEILLKCQLSIR